MPKLSSSRYCTTNWPAYIAALRRRGSLSIWFDPTMAWHAAKTGKHGHPETFSESAIQTCLTWKVLFGLPLRQMVELVASLIAMAGLAGSGLFHALSASGQACGADPLPPAGRPRYASYQSHRHQVPWRWRVAGAQAWYVPPQGAPCFATGSRNHGVRRNVHIFRDAQTGDIRAVEFTSSRQGDRPALRDLMAQLSEDEEIGSVTAEGSKTP